MLGDVRIAARSSVAGSRSWSSSGWESGSLPQNGVNSVWRLVIVVALLVLRPRGATLGTRENDYWPRRGPRVPLPPTRVSTFASTPSATTARPGRTLPHGRDPDTTPSANQGDDFHAVKMRPVSHAVVERQVDGLDQDAPTRVPSVELENRKLEPGARTARLHGDPDRCFPRQATSTVGFEFQGPEITVSHRRKSSLPAGHGPSREGGECGAPSRSECIRRR